MRYVQCKKCKKVYPGSLKKCPDCQTKTPMSTGKKVVSIILLIVGISLVFSAAVNWEDGSEQQLSSGRTDTQSIESSEVSTNTKGKVTYENFEKIETGMTYEQVVEIFGKEGKVLSDVDIGMEEYSTTMYYWYDDTGIANCNVTIQGGKVVAKAQVGLR